MDVFNTNYFIGMAIANLLGILVVFRVTLKAFHRFNVVHEYYNPWKRTYEPERISISSLLGFFALYLALIPFLSWIGIALFGIIDIRYTVNKWA